MRSLHSGRCQVRSLFGISHAIALVLLLQLAASPSAIAAQGGLTASYFANESLIGPAQLQRIDATIDFNWSASPGGSVSGDHFSARWSGALRPLATEALTLILRTDDGVRVFPIIRQVAVDGQGVWRYTITKDGLTGIAILP